MVTVMLFVVLVAFSTALSAQNFALADDNAVTGPFRKVRVNVAYNDTIPCSDYTMNVAVQPATGTAVALSGGFIEYTPDVKTISHADNAIVSVDVVYEVMCGAVKRTATLKVTVKNRNNPANIIPSDVACYDTMPDNMSFGIVEKFHTAPGENPDADAITRYYGIDAFTSPLVGDLNGDGKPEIVIMGTSSTFSDYEVPQTSVNIYSGQTGGLKHMAMLGGSAPPGSLSKSVDYSVLNLTTYDMGAIFHRAPSILALADVDADGIGEILYCDANRGDVYALEPTFEGEKIVSCSIKWKSSEPYKTVTGTAEGKFSYPHPYVADLNGDGIPELIVYNKIYNARSGQLLMAWGGGKDDGENGEYNSDKDGLKDVTDENPTTENAAKKIRAVAMTGRRPHNGGFYDRDLAVPAIVDFDGDGQQEIITGNRIYRFNLTNTNGVDGNTYSIRNGPASVTLPVTENGIMQIFHFNDGFTRVADIDGDGLLDVIVATGVNTTDDHRNILVYVWNPENGEVKAAVTFYAHTNHGTFGIPFVGDINGKREGWDGSDRTRKLPEICILTGGVYINRTNTYYGGRTGLAIYPGIDPGNGLTADRFGKKPTNDNGAPIGEGHIIGLTYDAQAVKLEERLKLAWAMEHKDNSNNTGITLFDFDNNGSMDICYRDMESLRVVSPANSGADYVRIGEKDDSSVLFERVIYNNTGFEYPVIADVNMDGSADIVVTGHHVNKANAVGLVYVFEYDKRKFAPCPPVWNQSMYDPRQIRENLQVNARPVSMTAKYYAPSMRDSIQPYNGSWMQCAIVRDGDEYDPVVRYPDAAILDMKARVSADGKTDTIRLTVFNRGSATIAASTPVAFYDGSTPIAAPTSADFRDAKAATSNSPENGVYLTTLPVGTDIFPNEIVTLEYVLATNASFANRIVRARIADDGFTFPASGYNDCDTNNNTMAAIDCRHLNVKTSVAPSDTVCGPGAVARLSVTDMSGGSVAYDYTPVFQWRRENKDIQGATDSVLYVSQAGNYSCYVKDSACFAYTDPVSVEVYYGGDSPPALNLVASPANGCLCDPAGNVTIRADSVARYTNPMYRWYRDDRVMTGQTDSSVTVSEAGLYRLDIVTGGCMVTDTFRVTQTGDTVPVVGSIAVPTMLCAGGTLNTTVPSVINRSDTIISEGWQLSVTAGDSAYEHFDPSTPLTLSDHGKSLRYHAANYCGVSYSDTVTITVTDKPTIADLAVVDAICTGGYLVVSPPVVTNNNSSLTYEGWRLETSAGANSYDSISLPYRVSKSDNGKRIHYRAENGCGASTGDTVRLDVRPRIVYPDIRVRLCPEPARPIHLSAYLDTLNFKSIEWSAASGLASALIDSTVTTTGSLLTNALTPGTHVYMYRIDNGCDTGTARVFVRSTKHPVIRSISDTLIVCSGLTLSAHVQLNQILGLEADGKWSYDTDLESFVAVAESSSRFVGARIFNATDAWSQLKDLPQYDYANYPDARMFKFLYETKSDSRVGDVRREIVLIVISG